jgi:xanthine dehydrogenase/oxidase
MQFPEAKLIGGNTEIGIEVKFKAMKYPVLISTAEIDELKRVVFHENGIEFGAGLTLSKFVTELKNALKTFEVWFFCGFKILSLKPNLEIRTGKYVRSRHY